MQMKTAVKEGYEVRGSLTLTGISF